MKYLKQFTIILGFCLLGEVLRYLLPLPVPASVYGLAMMFLALVCGAVKLDQVESTADFLVGIMAPMLVPAAVGLMEQFAALRSILIPFFVINVVGLLVTFCVTGHVTQFLLRGKKEDKK